MKAVASGVKGVSGRKPSMPPASDSAGISVLLTALMSSPRQRHAGAMRLRRDRRLPPRRGSPPRRPSAERTGRLHLTSTQYDLISRAILASLMHSPGRVPLGRFLLPLNLGTIFLAGHHTGIGAATNCSRSVPRLLIPGIGSMSRIRYRDGESTFAESRHGDVT